jgi:surfeit locus 1 family protein
VARLQSFKFKPKVVPSVAAATVLLLTLSLGNWQLNRADEKLRLQQRIEELAEQPPVRLPASKLNAEEYRFRPVEVEGRFAERYTVYIDNRIYHGAAGYHVVTPLQIGNSALYVLINRGWIARGADRRVPPAVTTPDNTLVIKGVSIVPSKKVFVLSTQTEEGKIWQNLVLERYRNAVPFSIQPIVIEQQSDSGDGLVRDWERPDLGINMHRGYAFQGFALALGVVILYVVLNVKRAGPKTH